MENKLKSHTTLFQVTNDIFTKEDGEFLVKHGALPEERIRAVETGGCPHAAIREDISINLGPLEELSNLYKADLLLCESGGGNMQNDTFSLFAHLWSILIFELRPSLRVHVLCKDSSWDLGITNILRGEMIA